MFYLLLLYGLSCTLFETLQGLTCPYGEWENGILVSYVHVLCYQQVDFTPKCKPQRRESYQTLNNGLLQALIWCTNSSRLSPFFAAKVSTVLYPTFFLLQGRQRCAHNQELAHTRWRFQQGVFGKEYHWVSKQVIHSHVVLALDHITT